MKNVMIRFQIFIILLIFFSPILYFVVKQYKPQIDLARYDVARQSRESSYPALSWLSTKDKNIVDESGHPITLRGVNIASTTWGPEYEKWNPQAVTVAIRDWHANVIRTRVHEYEYVDNPSTFFYKLETQILQPAREQGAYVILHPWFGENTSLPDKQGQEMWVALASRYKDDPHILYDLFAEPRDISHSDLKKAYTDIIPKIRAANPHALIFVTGLDWGREINSWLDDPLPYDNIVYRTNPYNRNGEFEGYFGHIAASKPVFIGEFGTESKLTMTESDVKNLLGYADTLGIGWTAWHFSSTGCPCLLSDNNAFAASSYGSVVKNTLTHNSQFPYDQLSINNDPAKFYLYSDFLDNGFSDYSWLTKTTIQTTASTFAGKYAFKAVMSNAGGIYLHSSRVIKPSDFSTFHFAIMSSMTDNMSLRFRTYSDQLSNPIKIADYLTKKGDWDTVSIPTSAINLPELSSIVIESTKPIPSASAIYLDEVFFSK
jgi:endoglucanase